MGGWADHRLGLLTAVLLLIGMVMLYSASSPFSQRQYGSDTAMLLRQLAAAAVGVLCLLVLERWDYHALVEVNDVLLIGGLVLVGLTLLPLGISQGRWLLVGPVTFQPTEAVKLSLILYLSHSAVRKGDRIRRFSEGVLPYLILLSILALLVVSQPDLGMVMLLTTLVLAMLFFAGARMGHLAGVVSLIVPLSYVAVRLAPYRFARLLSFLNPSAYSQTTGYQTIQSLTAVGSGGLLGRGLGGSHAKLFYLPQSHNDFIMSILAEELGLLGVVLIVSLLGLLVWQAFSIAERAPDRLGQLLAMGIGFSLGLQALLNLGVVVGMLPVTGLTLPFFSNGGTSLMVTLGMVGILLNVSKQGGRT